MIIKKELSDLINNPLTEEEINILEKNLDNITKASILFAAIIILVISTLNHYISDGDISLVKIIMMITFTVFWGGLFGILFSSLSGIQVNSSHYSSLSGLFETDINISNIARDTDAYFFANNILQQNRKPLMFEKMILEKLLAI